MALEDFITGDKSDDEYIELFEAAINLQRGIIYKAESAILGYQDAIAAIRKQQESKECLEKTSKKRKPKLLTLSKQSAAN